MSTNCFVDDNDFIEGIKKRDEVAFETLIDRYGNRLLKVCYLILNENHLAEDAVQEVFIQVYKNIYSFNHKSSLYTWIYKITINKCRDILKKNNKYRTLDYDEECISIEEDFEHEVLLGIENDTIKNSVFQLPAIYREIIILFYFEDLSIKEISLILNEKENTIKSKLHRGRNILRQMLIKEGITNE